MDVGAKISSIIVPPNVWSTWFDIKKDCINDQWYYTNDQIIFWVMLKITSWHDLDTSCRSRKLRFSSLYCLCAASCAAHNKLLPPLSVKSYSHPSQSIQIYNSMGCCILPTALTFVYHRMIHLNDPSWQLFSHGTMQTRMLKRACLSFTNRDHT